jgi:hypothetical protein
MIDRGSASPQAAVATRAALQYRSTMKLRRTAAFPDQRQCQRPVCFNKGQLRTQRPRRQPPQTVNLCAGCFVDLPAFRLNDLFLQLAGMKN